MVGGIVDKLKLIVADAHVEPSNMNLDRFEALGNFIAEIQPDEIYQLGDFLSMTSLSHWDSDKKLTMEKRRYGEDIYTANKAIDLMFDPIVTLNTKLRRKKEKLYKPTIYWLEGNHEAWCQQYTEYNPEMAGFLNLAKDLRIHARGFNLIPYRERLEVDGVTYCHIPMAKNNQPIGGKYATMRALERHNKPIVFGHLHRFEVMSDKRMDTDHLHYAVCCGCFFEEEPEYARGAEVPNWRGVVLLTQYDYGQFDFEQISLHRLKRDYL